MTEPRFTKRQMKRLILQTHAREQPGRHVHKMSVIGRSYSKGYLDDQVTSMSLEERALAGRAYEELRWDGLIAPSYNDLVDPDNWCWITDQGRRLLDRDCLDELDVALNTINSDLIEMRDGAHDRALGHGPDAPRQAAHSARELLLVTLRSGATNEDVKAQEWFKPHAGAKSGITQAMRARLILQQADRDHDPDLERDVRRAIERLQKLAHGDPTSAGLSAADAVHLAEITLRELLLGVSGPD